jgi:hypothetical protein
MIILFWWIFAGIVGWASLMLYHTIRKTDMFANARFGDYIYGFNFAVVIGPFCFVLMAANLYDWWKASK